MKTKLLCKEMQIEAQVANQTNKWRKFRSAISHVGLLLTLMLYTTAGGLAFMELERPAEISQFCSLRDSVTVLQEKLLSTIFNSSHRSDYTILVTNDLDDYAIAVEEAVKGGVSFPLEYGQRINSRWNFLHSVFFASTVITTIGYGNIAPVTFWGRLFCILFALAGIPLMLTVMADMGKLMATAVSTVHEKSQSYFPAFPQKMKIPFASVQACSGFAALCFLFLYLAAGAGLFILWEKEWGFFESFYFCFITMTTIGFGDLVPQNSEYMLLCTMYIVIGLALTSTIIELVRRQYAQSWRQLQALSGPLAETLKKLGGSGIDVAALQRVLTVSVPRKKGAKSDQKAQQEWEEAMAAVLRDITELSSSKKKEKSFQIIIYESSV